MIVPDSSTGLPALLTDFAALSAHIAAQAAHVARGKRAVVMTMGALHDGHTTLLAEARKLVGPNGEVLVTIFVNPLQFGQSADLDRYPRTLDTDLLICAEHGVDAVFAPNVDEIYQSDEAEISVDPGAVGSQWEGAVRPGHFRGVLTVVLKLLNLTKPDVAVFGEKDYQQLVLVRKMVRSLNVSVEIHGAPTARADDGVALSSRNVFLKPHDRLVARAIPAALTAGSAAATDGATVCEVISAVEAVLAAGGISPEYVVVSDPELGPAPTVGPARLLIAAHIGEVHLLDNVGIELASTAEVNE